MFSIGNQTALAAADPFEPFEFAVAHGFDAFEWFSDRKGDRGFGFELLDGAEREALRARGKALGMRFSVHAPWQADALTRDGVRPLHEAIDFAGSIDAAIVVCHMTGLAKPGHMAEALAPLLNHAREMSVCLAVENTPATRPAQFNALFEQLGDSSDLRTHLGMCFDMGHANLHPDTRHDYLAYLDALSDRVPIVHVHVHENFGDRDTHLPLGTGPAGEDAAGLRGLLQRLEQRDYHGSLIMEQWPTPPTLLCEARDLVCTCLSKPFEAR